MNNHKEKSSEPFIIKRKVTKRHFFRVAYWLLVSLWAIFLMPMLMLMKNDKLEIGIINSIFDLNNNLASPKFYFYKFIFFYSITLFIISVVSLILDQYKKKRNFDKWNFYMTALSGTLLFMIIMLLFVYIYIV